MTGYSRRRFASLMQAGAAMAVAGFRPPVAEAATAADDRNTTFAMRRFQPLLGSEFRVAGGPTPLTLIAVEDMPRRGREAIASASQVDCSLLRFSMQGGSLAEGSYRLAHDRLGDCEMHLTPGRPGRYLAYFCTLRERG